MNNTPLNEINVTWELNGAQVMRLNQFLGAILAQDPAAAREVTAMLVGLQNALNAALKPMLEPEGDV